MNQRILDIVVFVLDFILATMYMAQSLEKSHYVIFAVAWGIMGGINLAMYIFKERNGWYDD